MLSLCFLFWSEVVKIAYFGFDLFYDCLEYLSKSNEIVKIFTCKVDGVFETNSKVFTLAKEFNIPVTDVKPTQKDIDDLLYLECDLMVSAGYYHLIPVNKNIKAINIHPSLLPEGRGPWPMPLVILNGYNLTGITAHEITDSFDAGDIIHQLDVIVKPEDNLESLTEKLQRKAVKLLVELFADFENFWMNKKSQKFGSYWPEPSVKQMTFTLKDGLEKIDKITRAFYGYKCFLKTEDEIVEMTKAICVNDKKSIPENVFKTYELDLGFLCILNT